MRTLILTLAIFLTAAFSTDRAMAQGSDLPQVENARLEKKVLTGPLVAVDDIRDILRVPPSWQIVALIPIGFPDEEPAPTARKSVEQVIQWIE